jgi:transglutaminase-like putative cysteine protease
VERNAGRLRMSAGTRRESSTSVRTWLRGATAGLDWGRLLAVAGLVALTWAYVSVFWRVTNVVGGSLRFGVTVAAALGLAVVVGRFVGIRVGVAVTSVILVFGFVAYFLALPASQLQVLTAELVVDDTVALLTGLSVLRLVGAGVWATAIVPGPVFLSWYLTVRRQYAPAAAVGGSALLLVVLTGDAGGVATLVGALGATLTAAAATVDRHGVGLAQADVLTVVLAAMIVASATLSVVPGAAGSPILPDRDSPTVEASLVEAKDSVDIVGSIRLSPSVRFTVESSRPAYWGTAAYDRYTGDGWVRSGDVRPYEGELARPPGGAQTLQQVVTVEDSLSVLPAAWRPVELSGDVAADTMVTAQGNIRPDRALFPGENYVVTSRVPDASADELRRAGTDYPDRVTDTYLQLPGTTSERVRERSAEVAGGAETPYDAAVAIEEYLEREKEYSLSVPAPSGDVADTFLFEREAGYCTYYATTMVVMLRSQGIPARFVTGYTPGEAIENNKRVVRGLDSHAWVEVYFPGTGWIRFDPTPAEPRETAENTRLTEARQSGNSQVDLEGTNGSSTTPIRGGAGGQFGISEEVTPIAGNETNETGTNGTRTPATGERLEESAPSGTGGGPLLPSLPSTRSLLVGVVAVIGVTAGAYRTGAAGRITGLLSVQIQRRRDPDTDAVRAYRRLAVLLEHRYRPRRPGETPRAYVQAVAAGRFGAPGVHRVVDRYERARYGDGVTAEEADESVATVDRLVRSSTPLVRRFR